MKNRGFTLAEMLIVLGLLGSIAAMTIPTLSYSYKGKVLETQYKSIYSDLKEISARMDASRGDVGEYFMGVANVSADKFAQEFMKFFPGSSPYKTTKTTTSEILSEIYLYGKGPYKQDGTANPTVCNDSKVWLDNKGRLFSFNKNNQIVCIDINGAAAPNRVNVDIFAFKPMSGRNVAKISNDESNINDYTGQIIPCDLAKVDLTKQSNDGCPYYEPMENNVPSVIEGEDNTKSYKSAKGRTLKAKDTYWKDFIDYK